MAEIFTRDLSRRNAIRMSVAGAGVFSITAATGGKFLINQVSAQATPEAAAFDPATCYVPYEGSSPIKLERKGDPPYNLALSNSYIGNVWRTQMINMANVFVTRPDIAPLINDWQVASSGDDVAAQISQTENMITAGAQAIIFNPISPTALTPTIERARQEGIVTVSFDAFAEGVDVFVNEDQTEMGTLWAEFIIEQIGEKGKVLMVNGVPGISVDTDRTAGAMAVFDQYPEIETVQVVGMWDPGTAQTVTANALAAHDDIAAVWCQGGTDGVVRAFQEAGRPLVPIAGEAENGFRKQMYNLRDEFQGFSIGQSPGLVAVAIRVALDLLQGNEVPSIISVPLPAVKTAELVDGVNVFLDAPDNFFTPVNIEQCAVYFSYEEIAPEA